MFGAEYLENVWRYRLSYNGAPIGNGTWGIKWSRARWHHVTLLLVCRATGGLTEVAPFERIFYRHNDACLQNIVSEIVLKN